MATSRSWQRLRTAAAIGRLLILYIAFACLKHAVPLQSLARWAWRDPAGVLDVDAEPTTIARLTKLRRLIGLPDRDCLQRSLLLYHELSRAGADPVLVVGFRTVNARVEGHAWVISRGRRVVDWVEADSFMPTCGFGRGGELLSGPLMPAAL